MKRQGVIPLISIIVPVYNIETYVEKCILSIREQTLKDIEVILVDDGSTDNSGKICDKYAETDERIKVIHIENGGRSVARNTGMKYARGKYIGFVDGDDWIDESMYEELYDKIVAHDADIAMCGYYEQIGDVIVNENSSGDELCCTGEEAVRFTLKGHEKYQFCIAIWNKLYKRELLEDLAFRGRAYEDIMYNSESLERASKCIYFDKKLYYYRRERKGSIITEGFQIKRVQEEIEYKKERVTFWKEKGVKTLAQESYKVVVHDMLLYYGLMAIARESYKKAMEQYQIELKEMQYTKIDIRVDIALMVFKVSPRIWSKIILLKYTKLH